MHEWNGAEIPAVILALVVVFVSVGSLVHLLRTRAARRVEILQIQRLLAEEERLVAEAEAEGYANSVIENRRLCSLCQATTNTRCSRCKRVYYCSRSCQVLHWKQGHKDECQIQEKDYEMSDAQNDEMKPQKEVEVEQPQKEVEVEHVAKIQNEEMVKEEIENEPRMKSKVHQSEDAAYLHANVHLQDNAHVSNRGLQDNAHLSNRGFQGNGSDVRNKAGLEQHTGTIYNGHPRAQHAGMSSKLRAQKSYKILYPYEDFKQFYSWDELEYPCGLINGGNSCFANVVLQCLTYTRPLAAYLLDGSHRQECQREDWCFMCELNYHVHSVCASKDPFSPVRILSRMKDIGSHLGYGMQEDAHEFMRLAVSLMQKICLDEAGGEKLLDHRSQETTFIQYVFGGRLQSQVSCLQCHQKSKRYENMMDLTVEIEGAESLEDALAQFTAAELLDGENRYKCDRCNEYVNAEKRLTLYEAPNILTIALKRFQSGKFGKLNKNVSFPETLDLYQFMSREVDRPPSYKLYAVIVHVDTSNASFFGHYICYVKDRNGIWYKIDDSKVKSVDRSVVLSEKAYMLFYSRPYARPLLLLDQASTSSASQTSYWAAKTTSLSRSSSNHIFHPEMSRLDTPEKSINGIHFLNATPSRPLLCSWTEAKYMQFVTFTDVDKILEESPKEYYGISDRPSNRPPQLYNSSVKHFDVNHGSSGNLEIVPLWPKRRLDSRLLRDEYNSQDKVSCSGKSLKKQHNSLVLKDVFQGMDEFCGQSSGSSRNGFLRESYSLEDMDVFRNNAVAHEDQIMDVPPWFLESSNVKPPLRRVRFSATRDVGASENANVPTDNMLPCRTVADIASASDASSNLTRASTS